MTNKVVITSSLKEIGDSSSGRIKWDTVLDGTYELLSFEMSNCLYNVNVNNDRLHLEISSPGALSYEITLTHGFYAGSALATMVAAQITAQTPRVVTVTFDSLSYKYTLSGTAGDTLRLVFAGSQTNAANELLGFELVIYPTITSASIISVNCADLYPIKNLYVTFIDDNNRDLETNNYKRFSLIIKSNASFGQVIRYSKEAHFKQEIQFENVKYIRYMLTDVHDNVIDLNGQDWVIVLLKK
jgi:hypothetical protein